jgi:hypothetical protein
MNSVPTKPVKIIIGGHSPPALRRAARIADGWISVKGSDEVFREMISTINGHRAQYGTDKKPFEFHVGSFDFHLGGISRTLDDYRRLQDLGATDYCLLPFLDPATSRQTKIDAIHRFGDEIIARQA